MKQVLGAFAGLVLASCTTVNSVGANVPYWTGTTSRQRSEVAMCVAREWGKTKGFRVEIKDSEAETSIILTGSTLAGIDMVASIHADGRIEMHKRPAAWSHLDARLRDATAACAANPA